MILKQYVEYIDMVKTNHVTFTGKVLKMREMLGPKFRIFYSIYANVGKLKEDGIR